MKGINRPSFPTSSDTPDGQRLLASVNELTTALLNSGAVLSRATPGAVLRSKVSTGLVTPVNLAWGSENRVDVGISTGVAFLPTIRPEFIGTPLYMVKASPSGTVQVRPSGAGSLVNSFSGITKQAAGLSMFLTDGTNWWGA